MVGKNKEQEDNEDIPAKESPALGRFNGSGQTLG
jgi:hypothetical protein